jgi:AAA15 family ATPase/GTPase
MILSAIANAPGGVALVDEIENGLHYSAIAEVWKAIADAARRLHVQVFATTNRSSLNWHDGRHDLLPWLNYFLALVPRA